MATELYLQKGDSEGWAKTSQGQNHDGSHKMVHHQIGGTKMDTWCKDPKTVFDVVGLFFAPI